ncbi:MAG: chemotaxis protein CheW [Nitrospinae bacterium]|nr:chemotaxis protein CheW [Nitrospinota bacterium]
MVEEEHDHTFEDMVQMVGMRLETEMFGVDIMKVQEIIRVQEVTRVPRTENYVRGVVNLRGKVIPVISLRERFSFPAPEGDGREARIMIVNTLVGTVGFEVDAVTEVFRLPKSSIVPPPPTAARLDSEYIVGVGTLNGKLLVVLNLDRLLSGREE